MGNEDDDSEATSALDVPKIISVASNGFLLLIIAEGIGLLLGGGVLVPLATAAVYVYVGRKAARGQDRPIAHGAWAAAIAYGLVIPLRFIILTQAPDSFDTPPIGQIAWESALSLVLAVVIGALAGRIEGGSAEAAAE